jgi:hypothetical protein
MDKQNLTEVYAANMGNTAMVENQKAPSEHLIATTNPDQHLAIQALSKNGWVEVARKVNPKTNNLLTLWYRHVDDNFKVYSLNRLKKGRFKYCCGGHFVLTTKDLLTKDRHWPLITKEKCLVILCQPRGKVVIRRPFWKFLSTSKYDYYTNGNRARGYRYGH